MAFKVYRQGNYLIIASATEVLYSKYAVNVLVEPDGDDPNTFRFYYLNNYQDVTERREFWGQDVANLTNNEIPTPVAFTKTTFIEFYTTNTGVATAISPVTPESGIVDFFIDTVGHVGSGVGWADIGLIGDVPVVLFDRTSEESQVDTFKVLSRIVLTDVNPIIRFVTYSTTLPVVTTGDAVRWQLEARYIGVDELATKSPDETLLQTQTFSYITADDRQDDITFTLDRTLMALQDSMHLTLTRIAGDAADNYNADIGVSESDLSAEVTTFNP